MKVIGEIAVILMLIFGVGISGGMLIVLFWDMLRMIWKDWRSNG